MKINETSFYSIFIFFLICYTNSFKNDKLQFQRSFDMLTYHSKDDIIKFLKVEILEEGTNNYLPKQNDEITVLITIHKSRKNEMKKESEKEITLKIGDTSIFKCYNLIVPILSANQKVKFNCPPENHISQPIPTIYNIYNSIPGRSPGMNTSLTLKVTNIKPSWSEEEIIKFFKVETIDNGNTTIFPKQGDSVYLHYKLYNSKTGILISDSRNNSSIYNQPFIYIIGGPNDVIECYNIIIPIVYLNQKLKCVCPSDYAYGGNQIYGKIDQNTDLIFEWDIIDIKQIQKRKEKDEL